MLAVWIVNVCTINMSFIISQKKNYGVYSWNKQHSDVALVKNAPYYWNPIEILKFAQLHSASM